MVLAIQVLVGAALVIYAAAGFPGITADEDGDGDRPAAAAPLVGGARQAAPPRPTVNRFDERRAFALLREQVETYGWRPAGSPALRRLAGRLRTLLPAGRFEDVPGTGSPPTLRNVIGTIPGRRPAIVIGAHYDVEAVPQGFVGANDGAAGTAAVVTLARAFRRAPRPARARELRFVLFDGEEEPAGCTAFFACALRGSKAYAAAHAREVSSLVLLDYVAERSGLRFTREAGSDPALWTRLRRAARAIGVGAVFPAATSGPIIDDHTPFTQRGIPAIDLIDFDYRYRDTLQDTVDKVSARSLDVAGETVYRLVDELRRAR